MKIKKIILILVFIIGVISLFLMTSSFSTRNACEFASSNIEYIKSEQRKALISDDFKISKYHAFKALNGIEKTRLNFLDCGCSGTIESLEKASTYLKNATATKSFEDSKEWLHLALENTVIGIKVLRVFEQESSNDFSYGVMGLHVHTGTHEVGTLLPHGDGDGLKKKVHKCLLGFQSSLDKVVTEVDCEEANRFISKIHEDAQTKLLKTELTVAKKEYHQRVKTIAKDALDKLGECKE